MSRTQSVDDVMFSGLWKSTFTQCRCVSDVKDADRIARSPPQRQTFADGGSGHLAARAALPRVREFPEISAVRQPVTRRYAKPSGRSPSNCAEALASETTPQPSVHAAHFVGR